MVELSSETLSRRVTYDFFVKEVRFSRRRNKGKNYWLYHWWECLGYTVFYRYNLLCNEILSKFITSGLSIWFSWSPGSFDRQLQRVAPSTLVLYRFEGVNAALQNQIVSFWSNQRNIVCPVSLKHRRLERCSKETVDVSSTGLDSRHSIL
jgi:hypothetical protein